MQKINILIVGYGAIGKQYHSLLRKNFKKYQIVIVSKHKKKYQKNNGVIFENSLSYVLKKYQIYAAIVCSPASEHLLQLNALLSNKIHVLVEKPLFDKPIKKKIYNNLTNVIERNKLIVVTGYLLRHHPLLIQLKKELKANSKKNIINIEMNTTSYLPSWRSTPYELSVSAQKKLGGGVLNELSHEIDLIYYLFGMPKSCFARIMNTKKLRIDVEDVAEAVINIDPKLKIFLHLDFSNHSEVRYIKINYKHHYLLLDLINAKLIKREKNKTVQNFIKIDKPNLLLKQFNFFLELVKKKKISTENFASSSNVSYLIGKLKKSSSSNSEIKIS
jgi:predicted dehydrogenase